MWSRYPDADIKRAGAMTSRATLANKPGAPAAHREEHEAAVNTIAQGRPECFGAPVATCLVLFSLHARLQVPRQAPAFPAPSDFVGHDIDARLGRIAPWECGVTSPRHCEERSDEAIRTAPA